MKSSFNLTTLWRVRLCQPQKQDHLMAVLKMGLLVRDSGMSEVLIPVGPQFPCSYQRPTQGGGMSCLLIAVCSWGIFYSSWKHFPQLTLVRILLRIIISPVYKQHSFYFLSNLVSNWEKKKHLQEKLHFKKQIIWRLYRKSGITSCFSSCCWSSNCTSMCHDFPLLKGSVIHDCGISFSSFTRGGNN